MRGAGVQARIGPAGKLGGGPAAPAAAGVKARVRLGSLRWLRESGVDLKPGEAFEAEWAGRGATLLGLAADHQLLGAAGGAGYAETRRGRGGATPAAGRLAHLPDDGGQRGDGRAIAKQAGVPEANVFAEARPEEKARLIGELRQRGERVAFVGDGINDAPALAAADLGIAVSRASDVAREAADMILLKSELETVPEALDLARATLRTIKQNLFWAFFYNAAGIPLAALGFLSPILCALAMGVSDLVVIGNALRLLRRGP